MRYLLDANLSPKVASSLTEVGFEASHVADHDLLTAPDERIFDYAVAHQLTVITADTDFAMLLALRRASSPSVVLLRDTADQAPEVHARLLLDNLGGLEGVLEAGAIVSLSPQRIRVRDLPIT
ncbi:MAG: DUF5615 family PIN-like protein [Acidimicrobiales bacterium]|nr:DUF5615 family PIN-like protein [Acidimicrobiales bacterium]